MKRLTTAGERLGQGHDLAAVLDAACDAFEEILAVIGGYEDASDGVAFSFLLAATQAANGRDALLFAPSLPARRLHPAGPPGEKPGRASAQEITSAVAGLCQLLASRLAHTATTADAAADRAACQDAARYARQAQALLTASGP
jgi:HJR/Mrr/RecB family endonuclease